MLVSLGVLVLFSCASPTPDLPDRGTCHASIDGAPRVLVYTRTAGYRHGSIGTGVAALRTLGAKLGFGVDHTEDPAAFTPGNLVRYGAVLFLNTTQDVLGPAEEDAFEQYVTAGGGFVGVHAAADTEYQWPWYGELVGAWFKSHPAIQEARLVREDSTHPATRCLPPAWVRTDEWYDFRSPPPADAQVLLTIDEASYRGGGMGTPHPMSWSRSIGAGRMWYTGLGHTESSYAEPAFLDHLAGGILWALGGN